MTIDAVEEKEKNNWTLTLPLLPRHNSKNYKKTATAAHWPLEGKTGITQS